MWRMNSTAAVRSRCCCNGTGFVGPDVRTPPAGFSSAAQVLAGRHANAFDLELIIP
jgi:hypothetical protein